MARPAAYSSVFGPYFRKSRHPCSNRFLNVRVALISWSFIKKPWISLIDRQHMNCCLFSRYWNGSGSLQTNQKFQKIAGELISRDLKKSRNHSDSNALELESRDKELADLRTQLKRVQVENERIKKRLQNEDEIQRTIEMTDQDLVNKLELIFRLYCIGP